VEEEIENINIETDQIKIEPKLDNSDNYFSAIKFTDLNLSEQS